MNTVLPLAPLALGRSVLALAGLPARHDLYAAVLGVYVLWAAGLLARQVYHVSQVLDDSDSPPLKESSLATAPV